ncbi:hypothetical protein [Xenorhabdus innexi]|uniref:Uncharacterized protein n=1 Tax=Xenorhabdus innexi TaxID=290109 RepID=A0A1N6MZ35_9GAMM|nr:hypothetical protein [Xenorhabdus innexi]PHM31220.1 hypothetical protein Xinn_02929 [Xenorhabdus innexi]SIP74009.1 hypothetical protein XIS1_490006 [Xenorhabdus innexi]
MNDVTVKTQVGIDKETLDQIEKCLLSLVDLVIKIDHALVSGNVITNYTANIINVSVKDLVTLTNDILNAVYTQKKD